MEYIFPTAVLAPKRQWSLVQVLFDGGASEENPSGSSLAIGRWDGRPVLAMRWNGSKISPLGNPQSRGLPTWFIVPDQHWKQILETEHYRFSDDKINFALDFLELRRVYFLNRCPNPACRDYQRLVLHSYPTNEAGATLDKLNKDELNFYHIICDHFWRPTQNDKANLSDLLVAARESDRRGPGVTLAARLLDDGTVVTCQHGLKAGAVAPSKPQDFKTLEMQLDNNAKLTAEQKSAFYEKLKENRTASIFLPAGTSAFMAL
jgi:hypothetical protein